MTLVLDVWVVLTAVVAGCLRGALTPLDLRAVCVNKAVQVYWRSAGQQRYSCSMAMELHGASSRCVGCLDRRHCRLLARRFAATGLAGGLRKQSSASELKVSWPAALFIEHGNRAS